MSISINDVKKIAELARIELTPAEEARFAETISAVLEYMKLLNEVDTENVVPTFQVNGLVNVTREDIVQSNPYREALLKSFPATVGKELLVPGVFGDN